MINAPSNAVMTALSGLLFAQKQVDESAQRVASTAPGAQANPDFNAQTRLQAPLVDQDGQVVGSDVNFAEEAITIIQAQQNFAANAKIIAAVDQLSLATTDIFK